VTSTQGRSANSADPPLHVTDWRGPLSGRSAGPRQSLRGITEKLSNTGDAHDRREHVGRPRGQPHPVNQARGHPSPDAGGAGQQLAQSPPPTGASGDDGLTGTAGVGNRLGDGLTERSGHPLEATRRPVRYVAKPNTNRSNGRNFGSSSPWRGSTVNDARPPMKMPANVSLVAPSPPRRVPFPDELKQTVVSASRTARPSPRPAVGRGTGGGRRLARGRRCRSPRPPAHR